MSGAVGRATVRNGGVLESNASLNLRRWQVLTLILAFKVSLGDHALDHASAHRAPGPAEPRDTHADQSRPGSLGEYRRL